MSVRPQAFASSQAHSYYFVSCYYHRNERLEIPWFATSHRSAMSYEIGRKESLELVRSAPWTGIQQSPARHGYGLYRFTSSLSVGQW